MKDAKPERLIKALKAEGFQENGGTKHRKFAKDENQVIVPIHGIIKRNTVESIRKQANLSKEVFYSYKF